MAWKRDVRSRPIQHAGPQGGCIWARTVATVTVTGTVTDTVTEGPGLSGGPTTPPDPKSSTMRPIPKPRAPPDGASGMREGRDNTKGTGPVWNSPPHRGRNESEQTEKKTAASSASDPGTVESEEKAAEKRVDMDSVPGDPDRRPEGLAEDSIVTVGGSGAMLPKRSGSVGSIRPEARAPENTGEVTNQRSSTLTDSTFYGHQARTNLQAVVTVHPKVPHQELHLCGTPRTQQKQHPPNGEITPSAGLLNNNQIATSDGFDMQQEVASAVQYGNPAGRVGSGWPQCARPIE